ncbi:MAG TPA: YpmS family protein [Bacillota bacterium]|nr:YpmS family protein [Bacillota bacterium]
MRTKDKWKRNFIILGGINVLIIVTLATLIFWPTERIKHSPQPSDHYNEGASSEFVVKTTRQNLNELVNAYVDNFLEGTNHQYSISLEEDVHLQGELPIFTTTVPLSIHLEPLVQDNGDIVLKQRSISVGLLELPNKKIMEYIKKYLTMPDWVTVNPAEEEIYVAISDMDIKSNFRVSVEHLDLEANNIAIKIFIPYKTLGLEGVEKRK